MPLYQYLRWLCLFILGLNVAAAVIQPSTTVRDLDGRQSDLQLPTPPPLRDSSVESISPVERVQSDAEHIYNENVIIPNVNDADRANMDSRRGHETSETSPPNERFVAQTTRLVLRTLTYVFAACSMSSRTIGPYSGYAPTSHSGPAS
ncbi:hypothetical protein N7492_005673 [Penicillium capsulatum]|uniref:Uncharacterized protein n=1 Tax=Penicillium capsulatum TaxID=69766 RepID=A0A9W9LS50_9EURO|nr:hypothetical protein N7492_005673 [Penicillium capsulatum]KAJ6135230.1 hypothetical protein N7512_000390 [Penicillium capsulatum]